MLRLNVLVVLSFILFLDVVKSSPKHDEFIKIYKNQLKRDAEWRMVYKPGKKFSYEKVCNSPKEQLAALCKNVIKRLRTNYQVYNNIYMNYLPYNVQKPPCTDVEVWTSKEDELVHQRAVNCFARPAVIALESSKEMAQFYRKIVVYPWNSKFVMVFEYNENINYYTLLTFNDFQWKLLSYAVNSLFYTPIPQGWSQVPDLYSILYPIHTTLNYYSKNPNNVVNSGYGFNLLKICYLVFKTEDYNKEWHANSERRIQEPHELQAILRGPRIIFNISVPIMAYTCENSIFEDTTFMSEYYLAAGPDDLSVILLQKVGNDNNGNPLLEIIKFIEHLTENYVHFYYKFSY